MAPIYTPLEKNAFSKLNRTKNRPRPIRSGETLPIGRLMLGEFCSRARSGNERPCRNSPCRPIGGDGPTPSGEPQTAQNSPVPAFVAGLIGLPRPTRSGEIPAFVRTVITFSFLIGIGHMTYRWKALGTSYHLTLNHLKIIYILRDMSIQS